MAEGLAFPRYESLWRHIDAEGAGPFVHYYNDGGPFGDEGHFDHVWYRRKGQLTGAIGLCRAGCPDQGDYWTTPSPNLPNGTPADLLREYITLAHAGITSLGTAERRGPRGNRISWRLNIERGR
jgi:hypothetical protein